MSGSTTTRTVVDLIGQSIHSSDVQQYIKNLSMHSPANSGDTGAPTPTTKGFPDVTFYNYPLLGLSIECTNDKSHTIEAVHCYASKNGTKEFQTAFTGTLPNSLSMQLDNVQIVSMFGEPDKKVGGNSSIPVWISYEGKSKIRQSNCSAPNIVIGFQIDFLLKQWEAVPNPVAHYTFWKL